jgi:hypothetical protein
MQAKLRQLECTQGFVHLMYNLLEMLGKVMEFMLASGSAVCGNGQRLLPVRALNPLMRTSVPTQMDLVGSVPHRTYSVSQSSKASIPVESVLGVSL